MVKTNKQSFNFKVIFFFLSIICVIAIFSINRLIINKLREETREQVEYLAKSYTEAINSENEEDIRYVMDILLPSLNFPIIITSKNEISSVLNLKYSKNQKDYINSDLWHLVKKMDNTFEPLDLKWNGMKWGEIHYSDHQVISQLRWMPIVELSFGILFLIIILWGFRILREGEKNMIYVGMAKETAHQLGTPISSLLGWMNLLQQNKSDKLTILNSINDDIKRLSQISDRFSKIGSNPKLYRINLYDLLLKSKKYMEERLPKNSSIKIVLDSQKNVEINGNEVLLTWAVENLLKNSIDAIGLENGLITMKLMHENNQTIMHVVDTGKGINRKKWKKIFMPGYSSKRIGWGLGLSLTKRIVNKIHNGTINVIKSKYGETIFQIRFFN